ncbi:MAG TPA: MFS transporter [Anaerolineaceae bacterium]|nr:MFS transporter [Anaerolineaceae bacterium]
MADLADQKKPNQPIAATTRLPFWVKLVYGSGDWGKSGFNTLRQIFYAIFLTDTVGLEPRLASIAALVGVLWDAINDPLVGALSDNVRTRWGRRRPFLLLFSVPFALAFILLWWAPPWQTQVLLLIHITLAYMFSDTIQTLVTVPYLALTPELAPDYDQRTSLTTVRMFFNLLASLVVATAAPMILDVAIKAGFTAQRGYLIIAMLFGGLAIIPFLLIFIFIKEKPVPADTQPETFTLRETARLLFQNRPFRYASGIYVLNWISFDFIGLMLPYFLLYWVAQGNLLEKVNLLGMQISLESVVLGLLIITATLFLPVWSWLAQRFSKRSAYIGGMSFWIVVQLLMLLVQPNQLGFSMLLAFLAGISVSTAHVMPDAIFPDVIDWDEYLTHTRHEGIYYGAINLLRKASSALAIFVALQVLGWFGYQTPPETASVFQQPERTVFIIRLLAGPVAAVLLLCAVVIAWFYPLTRERQRTVHQTLLRRRRERDRQASDALPAISTPE